MSSLKNARKLYETKLWKEREFRVSKIHPLCTFIWEEGGTKILQIASTFKYSISIVIFFNVFNIFIGV